ncbi:MAG: MFS transporter [Clostridiales bacterium]|nr:MFS transporter [Clostridiales bacterium]
MFSFIQKMDKKQRGLLLTCFFAFFANGTLSLTMGSVMPDLKAAYGLSDTVSGLFLSAHSAGNLIAGFISALIPLYLGERKSIMLMSSLAFIGFLMMTIWGNPAWLLLAFVFTGLGRGSVTNFDNRMVNRLTGGNPAASNMLHGAFAIGAILAPLAFLGLRNLFGWQVGLGYVILCGVISLCNFSRMRLENDRPDRKDKTNSTLVFLKNPSFLILAMMMFCYLCSEYAINGWLVTYIQNKESLLESLAAGGKDVTAAVRTYSQTMATLLWVVMLLGRLFCAWLSGRVSQKKIMMVSSFGVAVFFTMMLLSSSMLMVSLSVAGLGFCMAGICPMIYSDAAIFTNTYPMATGALLAIGSAGAIAMPTIVGATAEKFGFTGGMSAILVTVCLLMVFAVLNVVVKTRKPQAAAETEAA